MKRSAPREQPTPPRPPVAVKGRGQGLRITVDPAAPEAVVEALQTQLERRAGRFFADAPVVLELPADDLDLALAARLETLIAQAGMRLTAVVRRGAELPAGGAAEARSAPTPVSADAALLVARTLRGGQRVAHDGPIVVLGDVNPGAEVIAGGSVVVFGRLRGMVEAGLEPDEETPAVVCALDLAPTQLRIGRAIARAPEEPDRTPVPEIAREVDGRIVVDAWDV